MSATTDALGTAVDTENAAIFAYGIAVAYAASTRRDTVAEYTADHRARRDELASLITGAGGTAPEAAVGYVLPVAVTDPVSAVRAMLAAEEDCTRAYRVLLEKADADAVRRVGVDALSAAALRAARWRLVLQVSPSTVALPGAAT
ncbi:ferritin-like domain-containing protein [uncultured Williamsia sp.]|uniref:ferritin-like domain-containing protein n=1 Tax=uncultured Williamsia sp. TaxID=259311 RepID=UPI002638C40D|nr:ferritin-like domain-containing protein [uncultured Williamsia sp.]